MYTSPESRFSSRRTKFSVHPMNRRKAFRMRRHRFLDALTPSILQSRLQIAPMIWCRVLGPPKAFTWNRLVPFSMCTVDNKCTPMPVSNNSSDRSTPFAFAFDTTSEVLAIALSTCWEAVCPAGWECSGNDRFGCDLVNFFMLSAHHCMHNLWERAKIWRDVVLLQVIARLSRRFSNTVIQRHSSGTIDHCIWVAKKFLVFPFWAAW